MLDFMIEAIFRSVIHNEIKKHIKDPKVRKELTDGLTASMMIIANVVGYRKLWDLWRTLKKEGILRVTNPEMNSALEKDADVIENP